MEAKGDDETRRVVPGRGKDHDGGVPKLQGRSCAWVIHGGRFSIDKGIRVRVDNSSGDQRGGGLRASQTIRHKGFFVCDL